MTGEWIIKPDETQYVIQFKESDGVTGIVIAADRVEIKGEHLILYQNDSVVYLCKIDDVDNLCKREI